MKTAAIETAYHAALEPLTLAEREQFKRAEEIINKNYTSFMAAAAAMRDICNNRWYRESDNSWHVYCERRWGISGRHGYRMIQSGEAVERAEAIDGINEATARALAGFEEEIQKVVYQVALATATKGSNNIPIITAAHIRAVGDQITGWVVAGGMDDGSGAMQPLGVLVKAHVTEDVYERMMRQQSHIREKLEAKIGHKNGNGAKSPSDAFKFVDAASGTSLGVVTSPASASVESSGNGAKPQSLKNDPQPTEWVTEPVVVPLRAISTGMPGRFTEALEKYVELWMQLQDALNQRIPPGTSEIALRLQPTLVMIKAVVVREGQQLIVGTITHSGRCEGCETEDVLLRESYHTVVDVAQKIYSKTWKLCDRCTSLYLAVIKTVEGVSKDERTSAH